MLLVPVSNVVIVLVGTGYGSSISSTKENSTFPKKPNSLESQEFKSAGVTSVAPKNVTDLRQNPGYSNVDIFTYEEMRLATKHFRPDRVLGEGGFGIVYKGFIDENVRPGYKTTNVAIKELDPEGFQGDREWLVFDVDFIFLLFFFLFLFWQVILSSYSASEFALTIERYLGNLLSFNLVTLYTQQEKPHYFSSRVEWRWRSGWLTVQNKINSVGGHKLMTLKPSVQTFVMNKCCG